MCIFRRKPNPNLIDLHEYEHHCMRAIRNRTPLWPFPSILAGDWTDEEMAFLVDNKEKLTFDAIASELNRPLKGVMLKAHRLGLIQSNHWSKKEDELLRKYYNSSLDQLAFLLDRSKAWQIASIFIFFHHSLC